MGWDLHRQLPGVGSVCATAPTMGASGRGSHWLQVQKTCSVPSPFPSALEPDCLLRAQSSHTGWPFHGGHCLPPGPSPHCPGTRGLSRGTCSRRRTGPLTWCVSPASQHLHGVQHPLYGGGNRPREGRLVVESVLGPSVRSGSPISIPLPSTSHPCRPNTHGTLTPWLFEGHRGLSCYVQCRAWQVSACDLV